ncbi:MAG: tRNA (N(6)-L-threonylcarbamoyladenosine(37)-C(2))-methylthiotransferase MtaB [Spirochaeta sp.]
MKRIAFDTLGCKLNQYETDSLASRFLRAGYRVVDFSEPADCYIINTCTVTNKADRKSRNTINKAVRLAGIQTEADVLPVNRTTSSPITVITGCFVDSHREEMESSDRITYAVENVRKAHIFDLVNGHFNGEVVHPNSLPEGLFSYEVAQRTFHTRAMVKVQDGCDNFCTFCIIPFVRGRGSSRPLPDILSDVVQMYTSGYREIVLTGVNMSRYSWEGKDFADVVEAILETPGDFRIRISSLEPDQLNDRFLDILGHPKMCPHLHFCLQSGSERILLHMRRMYSYDEYHRICTELRKRYPGFNITTDIIIGFPGETEEDFERTCIAVRENQFGHVHLFPYSKRHGTRAERMPGHLPAKEKKRRIEVLQNLSAAAKHAYRQGLIGCEQTVLVEKVFEDGSAQGYGEHYCPVHFRMTDGSVPVRNRFYRMQISGLMEQDPGNGMDSGPLLIGEHPAAV